jgi:glycosyltransferase involved in cell wall biosynthesis
MPEKILLLNYYWPPSGGPAVQRWVDISNYLVDQNIQTYVVTIDEKVATFPFVDHSLEDRIAPSTKIYKTDTSELFNLYKKYIGKGKVPSTGLADEPNPGLLKKASRFARGNFFLPDPRKGWNKHALQQAKQLIQEQGIKVVFTAGPPQSTHLVGLALKKIFPEIKWIADFHDYWTDIAHLSKFYRTRIAHYFDKKIELKVLRTADQVMTHCMSSQRILSSKLGAGIDPKIFVHTMGFNEDLFPGRNKDIQHEFTITYTGTLSEMYQPEVFFQAFKSACDRNPGIPVKLLFMGSFFSGMYDMIAREGLKEVFKSLGYVPHSEAINAMYKSSALLLINPKSKDEKNIVPGKIYEYLASLKPIISISSEQSENGMIIKNCNAGQNFDWKDKEGLTDYIDRLMKEWQKSRNIDLPENTAIQKYGRRYEADLLAQRIKIVLG